MLKKFLIGTFAVAALALALTVSAAYDFGSVTLRVGSKGPAVMAVQTVVGATVDGSYGPMTKAAVMAWQAANGLTADGVFGPMSMAKANAGSVGTYPAGCTSAVGYSSTTGVKCDSTVSTGLPAGCTSTAGYSATTGAKCDGSTTGGSDNGPLAGTDGVIATITKLSQYNAEEVGAGQNDVKVLGFDLKASKDGDIELKSIKLSFDVVNTGGSTRLQDYVDSVSVWMGSNKIGSASADDFNKDSTGNYSKVISLSNAVSRSDVTNKFYVTVDGVSNMDSGDIDSEAIDITVDNIRYVDGSGVVSTDTSTGDLTTVLDDVSIAFVSYATAADTKFKILTDSSSPTAGIVVVDDSTNTDNQVLLKGKIKVEGTSDLTLNTFPVTFTTVGATNIDGITGSVALVIDGEEFSESVAASLGTTATITFDNLDLVLDAGDTVDFTVKADINDIETGYFEEGDNLLASITTTNRNEIDVEDSQGDQVADADKTGALTGKAQEFRTQGIMVELVSTDTEAVVGSSAADDIANFKIKFKVTAIGENAYIATHTPLTYFPYTVDLAGVATTAGVSAVIVNNTDTTLTDAYNWQINAGESETLTLTVNLIPAGAEAVGMFRAALTGVLWASTDDNTPGNTYSSNMDSFKTEYLSLN